MNHVRQAAVHHYHQEEHKLIDTIKILEDSEEDREPML